MRPRRLATAAAVMLTVMLAVMLAACGGSGLEPYAAGWVDASELYVLREMGGSPLPHVATTSPGGTFRFRADTLRLEPDGTGVQVTRVIVERRDAAPEEERWVAHFRYELRGERFELSFVCPPEPISSCTAPPHYRGRIAGATLRLEQALGYPAPLVYERVDGA